LQELEIVIIDDGSTEAATLAVLQQLEEEGIEIIHTPNRGLAAARNEGMLKARGDYLLPLDADDRIAPTYLERAVAVLDADPTVGIVYGRVELFGAAVGIWAQPDYSLRGLLLENMIVAAAILRRSDWELVGGYRQAMFYGWEDWDFWLSLVALGRKVVRLPEVVFHYRIRRDSMTARIDRWQKLRMFLNLVLRHKKLYLLNLDVLLARCLRPGRRHIASPRD
jgi:glycosyltransferase involved in cell wall biosynthesis